MSTFTLKGRWTKPITESDRSFEGHVVEAGESGLNVGDRVTVSYQGGVPSLQFDDPTRHGRYSLEGMPSERYVLTSFVRIGGPVGSEAAQEGDEQVWGGQLFVS